MQYVFGILMTLTALFLILLVLIQRGRGGGLAGAFGGMGGQSAFGTKAGDTFTKITIGASVFWLLLCIASVRYLGHDLGSFGARAVPSGVQVAPVGDDEPLLPPGTSGDSEDGLGFDGIDPEATDPDGASDGLDAETSFADPDVTTEFGSDDSVAASAGGADGDLPAADAGAEPTVDGASAELSGDVDPADLESALQPPNE